MIKNILVGFALTLALASMASTKHGKQACCDASNCKTTCCKVACCGATCCPTAGSKAANAAHDSTKQTSCCGMPCCNGGACCSGGACCK